MDEVKPFAVRVLCLFNLFAFSCLVAFNYGPIACIKFAYLYALSLSCLVLVNRFVPLSIFMLLTDVFAAISVVNVLS